jgi:hypothetical protein
MRVLLHLALRTWVSGPRWRVSLHHHDSQRQNVTETGSAIENAETGFAIELLCQTELSCQTDARTQQVKLYIRLLSTLHSFCMQIMGHMQKTCKDLKQFLSNHHSHWSS